MSSYINGPVNYVQLIGNINNIQKNITIFMDVHLDLNNQTRCDSFDSVDISYYLYNVIKNTTSSLDFFMEIRQTDLFTPITNKRDIYINEVINLFRSEFIIEKDKVKYSKTNENVRLHYLDIRDYLELFYVTTQIKYEILPILNSLKNDKLIYDDKIKKIEHIKYHINLIKEYTEKIYKNKNIIETSKKQSYTKKSQKYYLDKIIHKYNNDKLKDNLNMFLNINIEDYLTDFYKIIKHILIILDTYMIDTSKIYILDNLLKNFNKLDELIVDIYTMFTDVYFLRRFLDKNDIQNAISYCGNQHAMNYIYFLVYYLDFKIIKLYNSNGLALDDIMNKIKNINNLREVYNLFKDENTIQCINFIPHEATKFKNIKPHYYPKKICL
jgi:hypothetical protein